MRSIHTVPSAVITCSSDHLTRTSCSLAVNNCHKRTSEAVRDVREWLSCINSLPFPWLRSYSHSRPWEISDSHLFPKSRPNSHPIQFQLKHEDFQKSLIVVHGKETVNDYRAMRCISAVFAVTQCLSVCPSVCLSVRLSRSWITSKGINISSKFFHRRVATPF